MLYCTEVYVSKTKLHFSTKSCHYREKVKTTIGKVHVFHYIFDYFSAVGFLNICCPNFYKSSVKAKW